MRPLRVSIVAPSGIDWVPASGTNALAPGALTSTVPEAGLTVTVLWNTGGPPSTRLMLSA